MGRMVLTVLGMVAEMEHGFIKDRQMAGIEAAKAKGIYSARRPKEGGNRQRGSSGIRVITTTRRRRSSMRANDEERQIKAPVAELLRRKVELLIR